VNWTWQCAPVYTQGVRRLFRLPVRRFVVQDQSMQPTLWPGDRLVVARWLAPRAGDIVAIRDPADGGRFLVKRIVQLHPNGDLVVQGDNADLSRDSRAFGSVPRRLLEGRVIYRYLPGERRGRL
jgi:nickel-type superoxide dismutase maturation protease